MLDIGKMIKNVVTTENMEHGLKKHNKRQYYNNNKPVIKAIVDINIEFRKHEDCFHIN